ncbi:proliferating cell nuclear antigen-like [Impatiens glandulifera]|uniref:proliferating cell nuclear antigen-like n=1 Tax=Impatiens glandulifera TaxID=253017 RepID=UPI001FB05DF3|nr:proliferating cell nuclear antigen-like [Impatiens glandulifera]
MLISNVQLLDEISYYEMKLMDIVDIEHFIVPEGDYHTFVRMPSSKFTRICKFLSSIGDTVVISMTKEGVKFSTRGYKDNLNIVCKQNTTVDKPEDATIVEMKEPISLTFELRYLNSFTKAATLLNTNTVIIRLSLELPMVVEYNM